MTTVQTLTQATNHSVASVTVSCESQARSDQGKTAPYRYAHLLPHLSPATYPPLTPFEHTDPGLRALAHSNPRSLLDAATGAIELTPNLGTEVYGISLARLDSDSRDQLALEVAKRGLLVFRDQQEFIDRGPDFYLEWGRHFGRLHIHPTSGHPEGYPELHLVYKDANATFNFERDESITTTLWHTDVSYELQPPGLTTFFLLSQPSTGGDTLFTSQVSTLKRLSPQRGGIVRREPVENVHPVVRKHPVTGEEALYVNRQFTRRIIGLKREESDNILNFLFDHVDKSGDNQTRVKWTPYTVVLWDNRVTAHSAIVDYGESMERRHGVRITPQAERPIPASIDIVL
ncbi:hypothetical protein EDB89DRAFT_2225566 [Lactarius sanguifluus]|nr:hypothetical protein EDB89DRAFT_2225566 [Lactarius sanguifluus]